MKKRLLEITPGMRSDDISRAAQAYADAGWPILIVHGFDDHGRCTCRDRKCPHPGKHPIAEFYPHGVKDADCNMRRIRPVVADRWKSNNRPRSPSPPHVLPIYIMSSGSPLAIKYTPGSAGIRSRAVHTFQSAIWIFTGNRREAAYRCYGYRNISSSAVP